MDFSGGPLETARPVLVLACLAILIFAPYVGDVGKVAEADGGESDRMSARKGTVLPITPAGDDARVQPCRVFLALSRLADFSPPSESCRYRPTTDLLTTGHRSALLSRAGLKRMMWALVGCISTLSAGHALCCTHCVLG